jgi:adenosylhomocysteine nucleosidase
MTAPLTTVQREPKAAMGRLGKALVAILTIVPEEYEAIRKVDDFSKFVERTPFRYRNRKTDGEYDIVLAQALDRSNVPCGEMVTEVAEKFRPEFLILSGIAGGVSDRDSVSLGDVIVADYVDYYEMRKFSKKKDQLRRLPLDHPSALLRSFAQRVEQEGAWKDGIKVDRPSQGSPKVIVGNLIAGEKLLGDKGNKYQSRILSTFDKALAVDMESFGLARSVYTARGTRYYNLNYLVVRGISDLVDHEDNDDERKKWRPYAAATAAAFAVSVADQVLASYE